MAKSCAAQHKLCHADQPLAPSQSDAAHTGQPR